MTRRKVDDYQVKQIIQMYLSGKSLKEVGDAFELDLSSVWYHLDKHGIERRPDAPMGVKNWFHRGGSINDKKAISIVGTALKSGKIKRPDKCQWCRCPNKITRSGDSYIQAHHYDYNYPLDVLWLCKKCHHSWHVKFKAIPKSPCHESEQKGQSDSLL